MHKDKDIPGMRLATQGSIRRAACNIGHKKRIGVSNKWNIRISESFAGREAWAWEILCCDYHKFISPNKTIVLFQLLHFKWLLPLLSQWRQSDPKAYSLIRICWPNLLSTFLFCNFWGGFVMLRTSQECSSCQTRHPTNMTSYEIFFLFIRT